MKKITTSNYLEVVKNLDFRTMPEAISESHQIVLEAMEDEWMAYNEVPEIRDMVDTYFEKLVAFLPVEKSADNRILVVKPKFESREASLSRKKGKQERSSYAKLHTSIQNAASESQLNKLHKQVDEAYGDGDISQVEKEELLKMMDSKSRDLTPAVTFTKKKLVPTENGYEYVSEEPKQEKPIISSLEEGYKLIADASHPVSLNTLENAIEQSHKAGAYGIIQKRKLMQVLQERKEELFPEKYPKKKSFDEWLQEALNAQSQDELDALQANWAADKDLGSREKGMLESYVPGISSRLAEAAKRKVASAKPKDSYDSLQSKPIKQLTYGDFKVLMEGAPGKKELVKYYEQAKTAHKERRLDAMYMKGLEDLYKELLPKVEKKTARKAKAKAEPKPKKLKSIKQVAYHDHFTDEEKVIKRFVAMDGKVKTEKQVKALLDTVNKLVVERKIRKNSHNAAVIGIAQDKLKAILKNMAAEKVTELQLDFASDTLNMLKKFAKQSKVYSTVLLLKRFIPMMGTSPDKAKAKKLLQDITRGLKTGAIQKSDTYYKQLSDAVDDLMDYLHNGFKYIPLDTPSLSGLGSLPEFAGLGCPETDGKPCGCAKPALAGIAAPKKKAPPKAAPERKVKLPGSLAGIFTQIDQPGVDTKKNTFRLQGDIGKLLGNIERKEYAIALRGDKGAGKTSFLYQLMDAFAEQGFNVASFTLEIDKQSDLVQRMTQKFIKPKNRSRIQAASIAPDGITTIREAAKYFDVVAIDSFSKLNANQMEFDKLRKDFPNTFFLVIFQSTTAGTARGGAAAEYDAGVVIQVDEPGVALCEKNRYADADSMGLKYLVHECKLSNDKVS